MRRKRLLLDARKFRADPSLAPEQKPFGSKVLVNACTPWKQLGKPNRDGAQRRVRRITLSLIRPTASSPH